MSARVFSAPACAEHAPDAGHPERPARLTAVWRAVNEAGWVLHDRELADPEALLQRIERCHDRRYLDQVAALSEAGSGAFGDDTPVDAHTWRSTLAATDTALAALEYAHAHDAHAFAAIRPPGHHALRDTAMGFCFVNHVAVLAEEARRLGRERVLIVDWDVHHGNGTQALVEQEPRTRFVSLHQWPWYPGTGARDERGVGNCFNAPEAAGQAPSHYVEALWGAVEAATRQWTPDLILISAGYDAMRGDPLGGFTLEPEHYAAWVERLRALAPRAPIVALMEGGYIPSRLAEGVVATVRALEA